MTLNAVAIDAVFAAPLRGKASPWPAEWSDPPVLDAARRRLLFHGMGGLLTERRVMLEGWPESLLEYLRQESMARAMWELRHKPLIAEVVKALHDAGIRSVVLKGTALAYAHYTNPALRYRGDTDLLISKRDLAEARRILRQLGWEQVRRRHGPFGAIHYQEIWQYRNAAGFTHDIDPHWEVTHSRVRRGVLDADQVLGDAIPLPAFSPCARRAEPVSAFIHRAVNWAEHARAGYFSSDRNEHDPNRLLRAVDMDQIATEMSLPQWDALVARCVETGVACQVLDEAAPRAQAERDASIGPAPDWPARGAA